MSGKGSLNNGGGGGVGTIPAGSRKMVESLKEIVSNYSDSEIYAVLKECNMDPNEAVNRLLSQDPFHEVKSKRDKRKENKDTSESRPRGGSSSSRGGRGGADRYVGRGSSESTFHGKFTSASKKENGSSTTLATGIAGSNMNLRPTATSGVVASENKKFVAVTTDHISSAPLPSAGHQPAWVGVPGQISMADIVKMGRPQNKSQNSTNASHHNFPGVCSAQHDSSNDEWPVIEQPSASALSCISEPPADPDSSNLVYDRINQHLQVDEVQGTEDHGLSVGASHVPSGSIPNRTFQEDDSGGESLYENDIDIYRHKDHDHSFKHREGEFTVEDVNASVSSAAENMQQLSIHNDQGLPSEEEGPSVVIPDHLQVQSTDCSHLSFGSFGSGISATLSGPSTSAPVKNHVEEVSNDAEEPPMGHLTSRSSEYYGGETNPQDGNLFHRTGVSGTYESPAAPQPDSLKVEHSEVGRANQYSFPSSEPGYNYENAQQLNVEFSQPQTSSPVQNLAPFNAMGYTNSLPSNLLAANANAHALRESDISYSIFPSTQAMPTKYGNSVSSVGGSSISMAEALKSGGLSSAQPTQQTLNGTGVATGPALPQHLNLHPYSQPTVPLAPFTNMIGYPFLPQNYTYMPSAFQQTFAGNSSAYHQSLAAMLPQYKTSVSVSSLPQSAGVASGYGAFGNTTAIPGNFQMSNPAAPATSLGYDDAPISQYKDNSHLMSLQQQQSENSATWLHGPGSRTMSAVPANTYYSYQGQQHQHQQQPGGFRQGQQPSQNYGSLSYNPNPNFYHSHAGMSLDHHQQQNPRDGSLGGGGAQGQQPKQSQQQIWQNNY